MVAFFVAGIFDLVVAVVIIAGVVRLAREDGLPVLFSYLFYLIFWYALVLYMLVFLLSPGILPDGVGRSYLLYTSIFIVPFHGLIAFFFIDFICRLLERPLPKLLKWALPVCFLLISLFYGREMLTRLADKTPTRLFVLTAPFSGYLLFACMFGALLYAGRIGRSIKDREWRRCVLRYSVVTAGALIVGLVIIWGDLPFRWQAQLTSMIMAAANAPGWFSLRGYFEKRFRAAALELAAADLSLLEERYGITPREREVISLVVSGLSNREITEQLFISPETVKKHIYNAYRKIGVRNRVQLVNAVKAIPDKRSRSSRD